MHHQPSGLRPPASPQREFVEPSPHTDEEPNHVGGSSSVRKGEWQGLEVAVKEPKDEERFKLFNYMSLVDEIRVLRFDSLPIFNHGFLQA